MKNTLVILSILFLSMTSYAQKNNTNNTNNTSATRDSLIAKMEKHYYKLVSSESYIALRKAQEVYDSKVNMKANDKEIKNSADVKGWVKANLSKTTFKTKKEADLAYDNLMVFVSALNRENKEYFDFLRELFSQSDGRDIWQEAMAKVTEKHP